MGQTKTSCEQVWREAMEYCLEVVGEDDYKYIVEFENAAQLMTEISELETKYSGDRTVPRMLGRMLPLLKGLETFVVMVLLAIGPTTISIACIWGAMSLLIQLASQSEKSLDEIANLLSGIHRSLTLFEIYSESIQLDPSFLKTLFDILVDLMSCSAIAIRHFRKNNIQTATAVMSWGKIRTKFSTILKDIADKALYLKNVAEAQNIKQLSQTNAELVQRLEGLTTAQAKMESQSVTLPCQTLPFARNPGFYGRSEILQRMTDALTVEKDDSRIRSVAIWGTGGIGKTQIALEYASRQVNAGLPIVLWIASEKETELLSSFNKAAQKLRLPGVLPSNTPDRNRDLVLEYLQKTNAKWLLIFDNVEDPTHLQSIWPATGHGNIIVTCRSEFCADPFVNELIEIPTFTKAEGSAFILKVAGQRATTDGDVKSAVELSERLGGLALALELIGKQIKARKKTVEQFLPYYNKNRRSLNRQPRIGIKNPYYKKDLETVWEGSFNGLPLVSARLLMLLCFVAPSDIPESIFTNGRNLPEKYAFLADEVLFDDAKLGLVSLSLISLNGEASLISLHRLTQQAYFDRMNLEDRREAFNVLIGLLQSPFSRTAGRHLYTRWKICSRLIQHVQALGDRYNELGKTSFHPPSEDLTYLITDATWYLQETGAFKASEKLVEVAFSNCADRDSLAYAYLIDTAGAVHDRQGHVATALAFYRDALRIHLKESPLGSVEVANAYSAVGNGFTGLWRASEGIEYAMYAIQNSPTDRDEKIKWNPDRYLRNRARSYFIDGQFEKSKADLEEAEHWQSLIHGEDSHYHGESAYMLGKIAACQNDLDEAHAQLERAFKLLSSGKPTHASVASAKFQQGCVYLRQGKDIEALRLFRDALAICQMNEAGKGTKADSARVKWRMSQAMSRQGMDVEAEAFRAAAEETKKTLFATGLYPQGEGEDREYDSLVGLLYR